MGWSPWGRQELDTTERLHFHDLWDPSSLTEDGTHTFGSESVMFSLHDHSTTREALTMGDFYFHFHTSLHLFLGKAMATHSNTLAWKIPWTEEPGGLESMGSPRVGHD